MNGGWGYSSDSKGAQLAIVIAIVIALRSLFLRCGDRAGQGATHQVGLWGDQWRGCGWMGNVQ